MSDHVKTLLENEPFIVMGVLNVTENSFYDGGRYNSLEKAAERAFMLKEDGAHILDIGAESTRPFSEPVPLDEERSRVEELLRLLLKENFSLPISIDTQKSGVAEAALDLGACMVNDVSAGRTDPCILTAAAKAGAHVVLMHMKGTPRDMQVAPSYKDVVGEVTKDLLGFAESAMDAGISRDRIIIDPGIGFGKRTEDNLELISKLDRLCEAGFPVLIGVSRKSLIGNIVKTTPDERLPGTIALNTYAYLKGARIFRVHDPKENVQALACVSKMKLS